MEKKEIKIELPSNSTEPYFCESESDFYKMVLAHIAATSTSDEEAKELAATGIPLVCHEYLALVISGKMPPYHFSKELVEGLIPSFKEMIDHINAQMAEAGVPLYEGDDGKIEIDYERLKRGDKM